MKDQRHLRHERRRTARSLNLLAFGGIAGVIAVATAAVWFSWQKSTAYPGTTEVDPMSMIGYREVDS